MEDPARWRNTNQGNLEVSREFITDEPEVHRDCDGVRRRPRPLQFLQVLLLEASTPAMMSSNLDTVLIMVQGFVPSFFSMSWVMTDISLPQLSSTTMV